MDKQTDNPPNNDPHEIERGTRSVSKAASFPWLRLSFFILVCGLVLALQGPWAQKVWNRLKPKQATEETKDEVESSETDKSTAKTHAAGEKRERPPVRKNIDHPASSGGDVRKMSKGFNLKTLVTVEKGAIASTERVNDESYVASYELKIKLPEPSQSLEDLQKVNSDLDAALPGLKEILPTSEVSPFFHKLYSNKVERLKKNATKLNALMTRHNFYDCETILKLKSPNTGRRVLLVQADMDVVSDGSDGDRLPTMPDKIVNSSHYQPMTSYGWRKQGSKPNPLIAGWKNRIKKANAEIAQESTTADRKSWLRARISKIEREIEDMESRSYLIADYDPFIVMPINMILTKGDPYAASVGDYAVVVYDGQLYPCIVGDAGPSFKIGEASLRMAKQLNPSATSYSRPVSDLAVTYLVFPKTADKFGPPNYEKWSARCEGFLAEIGGLGAGFSLHTWEDKLTVIPSENSDSME